MAVALGPVQGLKVGPNNRTKHNRDWGTSTGRFPYAYLIPSPISLLIPFATETHHSSAVLMGLRSAWNLLEPIP
ncbi:hypothetical protein AG1IA_05054 [Rhizoctonia solani AG-1 IA]|uniref:Uncharacterized protein n=1 Tax=Thanatephorus cucumeris (strain AG1-IA) TaxID=983506 RepID=L8WVW2_THACA|nr:hypothetical protein AG1IA_05054 [Rhizoctonia solani AG-1 IA]